VNEFGDEVLEVVTFADGGSMGFPVDIRELTGSPGVALT
jgi:hypothetical protein